MKISVFGMGYVGLVSAVCMAEMGHEIIGVDIAEDKVELLNSGEPFLNEQGVKERLKAAMEAGRFRATTSSSEALEFADLITICVGTPSGPEGELDLGAVENVSRQIARGLDGHTVILRSTVLPGTSRQVLKWIKKSVPSENTDWDYFYHPEFMREGNAIQDFYNPPFTVVGGKDKQLARQVMENIYCDLNASVEAMDYEEAEMMKYICNAFHALKIGFANEVGRFARELGVDGQRVMEVVCQDTKLNISEKYLSPGFAFGGSCLPKDVRALKYKTSKQKVDLPILQNILSSNDSHLDYAQQIISELEPEKIGVVGLSFKENTDDLRESPMLRLCRRLNGEDMQLSIFDHNIDPEQLHGRNRVYLQQRLPEYRELLTEELPEILQPENLILLGPPAQQYLEEILACEKELTVVDLAGVCAPAQVPESWTYYSLNR